MKDIFKMLGIIALAAIIGFSFAACGDGEVYDHGATLYVFNSSNITYYVKSSFDDHVRTIEPRRHTPTMFSVYWFEGEIGSISLLYNSEGRSATSWITRSYILTSGETRTVYIP